MERVVDFVKEKETKNTVRYQEVDSDGKDVIGMIYIQKWALGEDYPSRLRVALIPINDDDAKV